MDWEGKIEDICERLGVDTDAYNEDDQVKEVVAKQLGFSSFGVFNAFPEATAIIDGRGNPLLPEHMGYQLELAKSCVDEIYRQYNNSKNFEELQSQTVRFFRYLIENFQIEYGVAAIHYTMHNLFVKIDEFNLSHISNWRDVASLYGDYWDTCDIAFIGELKANIRALKN